MFRITQQSKRCKYFARRHCKLISGTSTQLLTPHVSYKMNNNQHNAYYVESPVFDQVAREVGLGVTVALPDKVQLHVSTCVYVRMVCGVFVTRISHGYSGYVDVSTRFVHKHYMHKHTQKHA